MQTTFGLVDSKLAKILFKFTFFKVLQIFTGTTGNALVILVRLLVLRHWISVIELATVVSVRLIMAFHSGLRSWVVI